jgi:hypothetical protein
LLEPPTYAEGFASSFCATENMIPSRDHSAV